MWSLSKRYKLYEKNKFSLGCEERTRKAIIIGRSISYALLSTGITDKWNEYAFIVFY